MRRSPKRVSLCAVTGVLLVGSAALAQMSLTRDEDGPVRRPGSVNIDREYDLTDLQIPKDEIHTLLPRDAIPALTDPKLEIVSEVQWLDPEDRVVLTVIGDDVLVSPFRVLDWHEVVNIIVGGEPIAVTYCPLCDSASVISRRVTSTDSAGEAKEVTLEFGVSGALYNSNVLMYDRTHKGLWSQVGMRAVSGPMAGQELVHLPVRVVSWAFVSETHPGAKVVSKDTGYDRPYHSRSPYQGYFDDPDRLLVPVKGMGDALPRKTLGVGILLGEEAVFVPVDAMKDTLTLEVGGQRFVLSSTEAGVEVLEAPEDARVVQTFYYSWSAFFPETRVHRKGRGE